MASGWFPPALQLAFSSCFPLPRRTARRRRMPHANLGGLETTRDPAQIVGLFTVQDITDYMERKLKT